MLSRVQKTSWKRISSCSTALEVKHKKTTKSKDVLCELLSFKFTYIFQFDCEISAYNLNTGVASVPCELDMAYSRICFRYFHHEDDKESLGGHTDYWTISSATSCPIRIWWVHLSSQHRSYMALSVFRHPNRLFAYMFIFGLQENWKTNMILQ